MRLLHAIRIIARVMHRVKAPEELFRGKTLSITSGNGAQRNCQAELMGLCEPGVGVNVWGASPPD